MKKIFAILLLTINFAFAQIPNQFNYQGVARDITGTPLANKSIKIQISILANGTIIYTERFERTTNQFGLFVLPVGGGTPFFGNFTTISWIDQSQKTLRTEIDPDGNGYSISGDAPFLSVPYAISAKSVETENQKLSLAGNLLSISQGNSVDISGLGSSQWEKNSVGINYNAGRVGIGTNAPSTRLHIRGNFTGTERNPIELENTSIEQDAISGIGLSINTTDRGTLQLFGETYFPSTLPFWNGRLILGAINTNGVLVDAGSKTTSNIELAVGPKNGQQTPVRMIVTSAGNVGVGTVTPSQKLDVNGKVRVQDLASDNTLSKVVVADAQGVLNYRDASTLGVAGPWVTNTAGINYSNGSVGIGTSNPTAMLAIENNGSTLGERVLGHFSNVSNANTSSGTVILAAGTGINQTLVSLSVHAKSYFPNLLTSGTGGLSSERLLLQSRPLAAGATGYITFVTGSNAATNPDGGIERLRIEHNGNVGISTSTPTQKLDVNGKVRIQDLTLDNTSSKLLVADATGVLGYRDLSILSSWQSTTGGIIYNQGKVNIGDLPNHTSAFSITQNATGANRTFIIAENTSNAADANASQYLKAGTGINNTTLEFAAEAKSYFTNSGVSGYGLIRSEKLAFAAAGNDDNAISHIAFMTGANYTTNINGNLERMRIEKNGFIGIGTPTPKATLHIKGSVYLEDATQGLIMKSPNGQCWKVTVGDTGTLTSTLVTCP